MFKLLSIAAVLGSLLALTGCCGKKCCSKKCEVQEVVTKAETETKADNLETEKEIK